MCSRLLDWMGSGAAERVAKICLHPALPTHKPVRSPTQCAPASTTHAACCSDIYQIKLVPCRFPIGKMDQVSKWPHKQLREFWQKWYYPANATLLIVGDLDRDLEATKELINRTFGKVGDGLCSQTRIWESEL